MIRRAICTLLTCLVVCLCVPSRAAFPPPEPETPAILLHPDLSLELSGELLARLDLFPDLTDLERVRFEQATWGAVLARLQVGDRVIVRSLSADTWHYMQERTTAILAGQDPPPRPEADELGDDDPLAGVRSWPETPPPPAAPEPSVAAAGGVVPLRDHWMALLEVGARVNTSDFSEFFTPMAQVGVSFGYGVSDHFVPHLGFHAGFGDMESDFEDVMGDGRTNVFGFTLSGLLQQPLSRKTSLYVEGGGGYYIRSLFWGGTFTSPETGEVVEGRLVDQKNLGWSLRGGLLRRREHPTRPKLMDIGFGVQTSPADTWLFQVDDTVFQASHKDTWVFLTIRFWDAL